ERSIREHCMLLSWLDPTSLESRRPARENSWRPAVYRRVRARLSAPPSDDCQLVRCECRLGDVAWRPVRMRMEVHPMFPTNRRAEARALEAWRSAAQLVWTRWHTFLEAELETRAWAFAAYVSALDAESEAA